MTFAPRVLSDDDLRALNLGPDDVVDAITRTLRAKAEGRLHVTPKSVIQPGDGRYMMTTLSAGEGLSVVKAVTVCPDNPDRGLPSITGAIMVLDMVTGQCLAVMDSGWITGVRTAGLSAVAAQALAAPEASVIGLVGCGLQARTHLELFAHLFPLKTVRAYGRGQANIERLSAMAADLGLTFENCTEPEGALEGVDIVVSSITITYDGPPFLDARRMKPGALAIVTDAGKPWIGESLEAFGTVYVDDVEQETSMPQPMVPAERIDGDLADIVQGAVASGDGPRAFMFRGIAAGDYALATRAWRTLTG